MIARYSSAVATGSLVTLGLFLVMNALIALQPGAASEPRPRLPVNWVRVPETEELIVDQEPPIDRSDFDPADPPPMPQIADGFHDSIGVRVAPPKPLDGIDVGPGMVTSDSPLVLVMGVRPAYPRAATQQSLEGYVIVRFDVGGNGLVSNVSVVESSHRVFERPSIQAAERMRFQPRVVDGIPIETRGVHYRFTFEMEH